MLGGLGGDIHPRLVRFCYIKEPNAEKLLFITRVLPVIHHVSACFPSEAENPSMELEALSLYKYWHG